jgi:hypothetical protein
MTQAEMSGLLGVSTRTLQDWKNRENRSKLFALLKKLDYQSAEELLKQKDDEHFLVLLENQNHFTSFRAFEKELFKYLLSKESKQILKKMTQNTKLSKEARARAAYLYTFLTKKPIKLSFSLKNRVGLYHTRKLDSGDGLARYYGLLSGIDIKRFNQYKMTGSN